MKHRMGLILFATLIGMTLASCQVDVSSSLSNGSSSSSETSELNISSSQSSESSSSSESVIKYTVTWKNYDGTVLETDTNLAYGTQPIYNGATPSKAGDLQYSYTFNGWSPEVTTVTSDAAYTAQFIESIKSYIITWKNYDGTTLEVDHMDYGALPSYDGQTPTKEGNAQYSYAFSGWSPSVTSVTGDITYTAQYGSSVNAYTISWKNDDGTTLEVDSGVFYGTMPSYDGSTPSKEANAQYSYSFSGWSPEVTTVSKDTTYTAQYSNTTNSYTIIWKNYDETILETDYASFGTMPSYDGATPKRVDVSASYLFSGWSPSVSAVIGDATYTAQFSIDLIKGSSYLFGTYPQSKVTNSALINTLNSAGGTLPSSGNSQSWTSYGFYASGSNTTNFMWYKDVTSGANKYRGVYFTSYRPYTTDSSSTDISFQDDHGYFINTRYWFKYEPIKWDILSVDETGGPLVASDMILDSGDYYQSTSSRTIGGATVYANNYKESSIRSWLNNDFYNQAFSSSEQSSINSTTVDNSAATTGFATNSFACENTSDKMFLLSYQDVTNATYGFRSDDSRLRQATDYATAMGVLIYTSNGSSTWRLRSPRSDDGSSASNVDIFGGLSYGDVNGTTLGVLPAFRINR